MADSLLAAWRLAVNFGRHRDQRPASLSRARAGVARAPGGCAGLRSGGRRQRFEATIRELVEHSAGRGRRYATSANLSRIADWRAIAASRRRRRIRSILRRRRLVAAGVDRRARGSSTRRRLRRQRTDHQRSFIRRYAKAGARPITRAPFSARATHRWPKRPSCAPGASMRASTSTAGRTRSWAYGFAEPVAAGSSRGTPTSGISNREATLEIESRKAIEKARMASLFLKKHSSARARLATGAHPLNLFRARYLLPDRLLALYAGLSTSRTYPAGCEQWAADSFWTDCTRGNSLALSMANGAERALLYCAGGGLGDSLVASVVARALRRRFDRVDALTLPGHAALLQRVPDLDSVLVDDGNDRELAAQLARERYEACVVTWATARTARFRSGRGSRSSRSGAALLLLSLHQTRRRSQRAGRRYLALVGYIAGSRARDRLRHSRSPLSVRAYLTRRARGGGS